MATAFTLEARSRTLFGKGASRRLRRLDNALPAIVYGATKQPESISLVTKDFIRQLQNEAFLGHHAILLLTF